MIVHAPPPILDVVTGDLPKSASADVQVLVVTLRPGDSSVWHSHPTPLFVYVQSGTCTWEYRHGRAPDVRHAGQALMEHPNVVARVVNRGNMPLTLVLFQATSPGEQRIVPAPSR